MSLVITVTLLLSVLGLVGYQVFNDRYWDEFTAQSALDMDRLVYALAQPVYQFDEEKIVALLERQLSDQKTVAITLTSDITRLTLIRDEPEPGHEKDKPKVRVAETVPNAERLLANASDITVNGKTIGQVKVFVTPQMIEHELRRTRIYLIFVTLLLDLIVTLGLYRLLRRLVLTPLARIGRYADEVAHGLPPTEQLHNLQFRGELEVLKRSIVDMVTQLRARNDELQDSEGRFRTLVENAPEAIVVLDAATSSIVDANPNAERLLECERAQILGSSITRFVSAMQPDGQSADDTRRIMYERALAGESILAERLIRTTSGLERLCEVRLVKLPSNQKSLLRISVTDVTERKRAEAAITGLNQRLQALLDAALEVAIIATDVEGRITVFNRGAERMLDYRADEVLGITPEIFHRESEVLKRGRDLSNQLGRPIEGFEIFVALTRSGQSDIHNWTYVRKDGRPLRVSLAVSALRGTSGRINGFLGIARDITEQLAAQADLLKLNLQLDSRVQERTRALQESSEQLQQAVDDLRRTQDQLVQSEKLSALGAIVAAVAHELNTPIGNSLTVATTLQEKSGAMEQMLSSGGLRRTQLDEFIASVNQGMQIVVRGLERAAKLVDNFKQVAVDQGGEQRRLFDLRYTIDGLVALMNTTLSKTPYRLILEVPVGIEMNSFPGPIEQIVTNLINNSVLHGFAGRDHGQMRLVAEADDENIYLVYSDDGLGMSDEVVRHVFDPFFTTRLGSGGSGLGMNICYNLITGLLGGRIDLSSAPGQGCRFSIVLPRVAPQK